MATLANLEAGLAAARTSYATLIRTDVPAFNTAMKGRVGEISPVLGGRR